MCEFNPAPIFVASVAFIELGVRGSNAVDFISSVVSKIGAGLNSQTLETLFNNTAITYVALSVLP
jgi:hypothetical protein